jgi:probable HAF family extracellular repeat protein
VTSKILRSAALLIVLAICTRAGTFTSPLSASGGSGGTTQSVTWPGTLGGNASTAYGVSAIGSVVVGYASNASGQYRAFRWTASGGMRDLGTLGGVGSAAYDVSADGSVVVGEAADATGALRAFRWTAAGGMQNLTTLYPVRSAAAPSSLRPTPSPLMDATSRVGATTDGTSVTRPFLSIERREPRN